ncbi:MAG: glycosyltransferase family 8 protein [Erysipelotrichales bacterium]|nr:glycosyltransferase family 8 protein [Erysipelotrichales bacterium]
MEKHIAFCVNNEYANYIRPVIKSIIELHKNYTEVYTINVLSDSLSTKYLNQLKELVKNINNIKLIIHIVDDSRLKGLKTGNWTIHIWYRILLPEILEETIERVLYLDADTLILQNLDELFTRDISGQSIAASIDYQNLFDYAFERCGYEKNKQYICSGVMLINLDYWRKNNLTDKIIKWAKQNEGKIKCPDQDSINFICKDSKIILPMKYGVMDCFLTNPIFEEAGYSKEIQDCRENPIIVHYNGRPPWYKEYKKHVFHNEWKKYNRMLPNPVKPHFQAKGILLFKILVWRILKYSKNKILKSLII